MTSTASTDPDSVAGGLTATQRFLTLTTVVLASSLYVADFFGDPSRQFADARPFEIIALQRHDCTEATVGVALATAATAANTRTVNERAGALAIELVSW